MPYSDNLYSADDGDFSDDESLSDQLSPADGYFSRPDSLPNVMVPDPSLEQGNTAEAKAQEAREEAQSNSDGQEHQDSSATTSSIMSPSTPSRLDTSVPPDHTPTPSGPSAISPSPISPRRYYNPYPSIRTPLIQGPPPAYSPASPSTSSLAPLTPTSPQAHEPVRNYNTFSYGRLEDGLSNHQEPQSMGSPPEGPSENSPLQRRQQKHHQRRGIIQKLLFICLIASIVLVILTKTMRSGTSAKVPSRRPIETTPEPDLPDDPQEPDIPKQPSDSDEPAKLLPPPDSGEARHQYCQYATVRQEVAAIAWPLDRHLHIRQTQYNTNDGSDMSYISTAGEVRLRRMPEDSPYYNTGGYVELSIYTSDAAIQVSTRYSIQERLIKFETPRYAKLETPGPHCISLEFTAWIRDGVEFGQILVETVELVQRVFDGIDVNVSQDAKFKSVTGGIHFPEIDASDPMWSKHPKKHSQGADGVVTEPRESGTTSSSNFSSRHIEISTTSGSITGMYPLYDYLGIDSVSGSVSVSIVPKAIDMKAPKPATLEIGTRSGSIKAQVPVNGPAWTLPPRRYVTKVISRSGTLLGSYITGSSGIWNTDSGSIKLEVLPMIENGEDAPKSTFHTATLSGSNHVEFLDPIFIPTYRSYEEEQQIDPSNPYKPIGENDPYLLLPNPNTKITSESKLHTLMSSHTSKSGSVQVKYPDAWEGIADMKAMSGSINIGGDVEIIKDGRRDWVHREVIAQHPTGGKDLDKASTVLLESTAGSISFKI